MDGKGAKWNISHNMLITHMQEDTDHGICFHMLIPLSVPPCAWEMKCKMTQERFDNWWDKMNFWTRQWLKPNDSVPQWLLW